VWSVTPVTPCITYKPTTQNQTDYRHYTDRESRRTKHKNKTWKQHGKGMKITTIINGRLLHGDDWKPTTKKKKETTSTPGTSISHKVKILGDSHLRGTASKIDQYLNTNFDVCSWIKPGANTKEIVNTLVKDLKCLGKQDVIVVNGGSNVIGSKENQTHKVINTNDIIHTGKYP
jgi:hypothetical protein